MKALAIGISQSLAAILDSPQPPVPQPIHCINVELPRGTVTVQVMEVSELCDCSDGLVYGHGGEEYACTRCNGHVLDVPEFTFGRVFTYDAKLLPVLLTADEWKLVLAAAEKDWSENS